MRADFTLWKNNDALNCTQKNNDALNYTQKKYESIFLVPIFLLTLHMNNEYALMHNTQKIPSSDDFANILELTVHTLNNY